MRKVELGKNGIEILFKEIGLGTGHPTGHCAQALMDMSEFANLLLFYGLWY